MTVISAPGTSARVARLAAPVAPVVAAAIAVGYVGTIDPNEPGHYPTCPFLAITGYFCPGCGTLRAVHAMSHGDLGVAIDLNVLTVSMVPLLTFLWGRWAVATLAGRTSRTTAARPVWIWLLLGAVLTFWLIRNLPFGVALAP